MQVRMQITGLMVDPVTNMPIVILKDGEEVDRAVGLRQHADLAASLDRQLG